MALYRCLSQLSKMESVLRINSRVGWCSLLIEKFLSLKFKPQHKECTSEEVEHISVRHHQSTVTKRQKSAHVKEFIKSKSGRQLIRDENMGTIEWPTTARVALRDI